MIKFICVFLLWTILAHTNSQNTVDKNIVCYYTNWSQNREGNAKFLPSTINPHICTHLIYAFATFSRELGLAPGSEEKDIKKNGFKEFNDLKNSNEDLKTLLSIGGWVEASGRFSRVAASRQTRDYFTKSAIELLRKYDFDGINLDWQYPTFRDGSRPEDYDNYVKFVESLRTGFEKEAEEANRTRLLVTMSVPAEIGYNDQGYDLLNLQKYADFFNILAYDYHLSYEGNVSHHSPLYPLPEEIAANINTDLNGDATVQYLLDKGMKKEKLNLGIPTFGRTYKLENPNEHYLGAPSKGLGIRGDTSKEEGYRTYYEICQSILNDNWKVVHVNKTALGPYAYKDDNWVGFDDEDIVRNKGEYVRSKGLAGIMFWTIDDDDFRSDCHSRSFPLIKAGREGVLGRERGIRRPPLLSPEQQQQTTNDDVSSTITNSQQQTTITMSMRTQQTTSSTTTTTTPPPPPPTTTTTTTTTTNEKDIIEIIKPTPVIQKPVQFSETKTEGGNVYHQTVSIWILNNILTIGDKK